MRRVVDNIELFDATEADLVYYKKKWVNMLKNKLETAHPEGKNLSDPCFLWTKAIHPSRYGSTSFKGIGKCTLVHRVSWMMHNKLAIIPSENLDGVPLVIRHKCDVRLCFQPLHLCIGTHQENSADAIEGNVHNGEQNSNAKLTEDNVREIRRNITKTKTARKELAIKFGVCAGTIRSIQNNARWTHVPNEDGTMPDRKKVEKTNAKARKRKKKKKTMAWTDAEIGKARALFSNSEYVEDSTEVFYRGTPCLLWKKTTNDEGYGKVGINGEDWIVHRLACTMSNGMIRQPKRIVCRHLCDNRLCCRSSHLAFGTAVDNALDVTLGTGWKTAKFTDAQVIEIRRQFAFESSSTLTALAKKYEVSRSSITNVVRGRSHRHLLETDVDGVIAKKLAKGHLIRQLSRGEVIDVRARLKDGETHKSIASTYNITKSIVSDISRGRTYRDVISEDAPIVEDTQAKYYKKRTREDLLQAPADAEENDPTPSKKIALEEDAQ